MPRGKRQAEPAPSSGTNDETSNTSVAILNDTPPVQTSGEPTSERPESTSELPAPRGQFRSWVVDTRRGYTGLTDETHHCIVLQFDEKPHPDVLSAVRGAGFQFRPDHYGLRNVWVRRNNFEGRLQVESIERLMRSLSKDRGSPGT